jgi:hypothetical protein
LDASSLGGYAEDGRTPGAVVAQALLDDDDDAYPAAHATLPPAPPACTAASRGDSERGDSRLAVAATAAAAAADVDAESEVGAADVSPYRFTPSEEDLFHLRSSVKYLGMTDMCVLGVQLFVYKTGIGIGAVFLGMAACWLGIKGAEQLSVSYTAVYACSNAAKLALFVHLCTAYWATHAVLLASTTLVVFGFLAASALYLNALLHVPAERLELLQDPTFLAQALAAQDLADLGYFIPRDRVRVQQARQVQRASTTLLGRNALYIHMKRGRRPPTPLGHSGAEVACRS